MCTIRAVWRFIRRWWPRLVAVAVIVDKLNDIIGELKSLREADDESEG